MLTSSFATPASSPAFAPITSISLFAMNLQAMLSSDDAVVASTHAQCPASPATSTTSSSSSSSSLSENSESDPLKRGWVAPFLLHLHQMLRRENPKIIRWTDDGIAFQILDKEAMTNQILPRYFKNKNFASFQRQLNYFGFRKWSKARAPFSTYSREHFTRDNYGDMSLVKRQSKKSRKRPASESVDEQQQDAKRAAVQPYWASGDKCKPILPRPGASATEVTPSPVPVPQQVASPVMVVAAAPVESISPAAKTWSAPSFGGLLVRAPAASNPLFTLPVISPARKVANGCKLPSIHDLSFSSALNSENAGLRPRWLA